MHELSLCRAVIDTVAPHADGRQVRAVRLRVGHFRQVVPESLAFHWELVTADGPLAGCALEVDHVEAVVRCRSCGSSTTLADPILLCGSCDGADVELVRGDEFLVESIELEPAGP